MLKQDLLKNLEKVESNISIVEQKLRKSVPYYTLGKYIEKHGGILDINSLKTLISAKRLVNSFFHNKQEDLSSILKELNLSENDIDFKSEEHTYLGYTKEEWDTDFINRAATLKLENTLAELKRIKVTLEKYLSDDDKFIKDVSLLNLDILM